MSARADQIRALLMHEKLDALVDAAIASPITVEETMRLILTVTALLDDDRLLAGTDLPPQAHTVLSDGRIPPALRAAIRELLVAALAERMADEPPKGRPN